MCVCERERERERWVLADQIRGLVIRGVGLVRLSGGHLGRGSLLADRD